MPENDEKAFEKKDADVSTISETSSLLEQVSEMVETIKNRRGSFPTDFDEKVFMDEGWEE